MVAVKSGLGYVLWDAYYVGRMDIVLADMVSIGLMAFLIDRLIVAIEHRVLAWRILQHHLCPHVAHFAFAPHTDPPGLDARSSPVWRRPAGCPGGIHRQTCRAAWGVGGRQ